MSNTRFRMPPRVVLASAAVAVALAFIVLLGPKLFEVAAPKAAGLMKFAVQRARGVAIGTSVLVGLLYACLAIAGVIQAHRRGNTRVPKASQ